MSDWQKKHVFIVGLLGLGLVLVWGMIARQPKYQNQYALECIDKQGNALLDLKDELTKAEERIRLEGADATSLSFDNLSFIERSIGIFKTPLKTTPVNPKNLCPKLSATLPTDFGIQPLRIQAIFLGDFIKSVEPEFNRQKKIAAQLMPLIFFGIFLQFLVSLFLTALINRIIIRKWQIAIEQKRKVLIDQFNISLTQFPYDTLSAILNNHPMGKELKRDLNRLTQRKASLLSTQTNNVNWHDVSRTFFKGGYICRTVNNEEIEGVTKQIYLKVRKIINQNIREKFIGLLNETCFILIFLLLAFMWSKIGINWFSPWSDFFGWFFIGIAILIGGVPFLEYVVRWFTEKTWDDFDDLIVGVVGGPLVAMGLAGIASIIFENIPSYSRYFVRDLWEQLNKPKWGQALITIIIGWLLVFILNKVIVYALLKWSERTEQKYDDMFVRIVQVFGTFILVAITFGVLLANFQSDIARVTGIDNVLLPYSIIVSVFSAVLGYASREAIENFFGGILLQVDRPFNIGERLKLESGEICDVRDVGMRSTVLYNILESTEISIPNSTMSTMKVTNISRPDYSLCITSRISVPNDGNLVKKIESILVDIGYLEGEVDEARIINEEVGDPQRLLGRRSLIEEILILKTTHPQVEGTVIARIEGGGQINQQKVFPQLTDRLEKIRAWRVEYSNIVIAFQNEIGDVINKLDIEEIKRFQSFLREFDLEMYKYVGDSGKINVNRITRKILNNAVTLTAKQYGYDVSDVIKIAEIKNELKSLAIKGYEYHDSSLQIPKGEQLIASGVELWIKYWEVRRINIVSQIAAEFSIIGELVTAIVNSHPTIRLDLDRLIIELTKEPNITSKGNALNTNRFVEIEFNFFSTFMERQYSVLNEINKSIRRRLWREGITVDSQEDNSIKTDTQNKNSRKGLG